MKRATAFIVASALLAGCGSGGREEPVEARESWQINLKDLMKAMAQSSYYREAGGGYALQTVTPEGNGQWGNPQRIYREDDQGYARVAVQGAGPDGGFATQADNVKRLSLDGIFIVGGP